MAKKDEKDVRGQQQADKVKRPQTGDGKRAASTAELPPVTSAYDNKDDVDRDSVDEDKSGL